MKYFASMVMLPCLNASVTVECTWTWIEEKCGTAWKILGTNLRLLLLVFRILLLEVRSRDFELGRVGKCRGKATWAHRRYKTNYRRCKAGVKVVEGHGMDYRHVWSGSNTWKLRGQLSVLRPNYGKSAERPGKACNKLTYTSSMIGFNLPHLLLTLQGYTRGKDSGIGRPDEYRAATWAHWLTKQTTARANDFIKVGEMLGTENLRQSSCV